MGTINESDIICLARYVSKVLAMRNYQRSYFNTKDFHTLQAAKQLEKQVDETTEGAVNACVSLQSLIQK